VGKKVLKESILKRKILGLIIGVRISGFIGLFFWLGFSFLGVMVFFLEFREILFVGKLLCFVRGVLI
jgi:hypothetical protein